MMKSRSLPIIVALGCILGGCSAKAPATARLVSTTNDVQLRQSFDRAYATKTTAGEYEIVLVDDGLPADSDDSELLMPAEKAPVRQVLYLKMNWRPQRGAKNNNPAASNALARWYFFVPGDEGRERVIRYDGTAFVRMTQGRDTRWRGKVDSTLLTVSPESTDTPVVTAATLRGSFTAEADIARVQDLVRSLPGPATESNQTQALP